MEDRGDRGETSEEEEEDTAVAVVAIDGKVELTSIGEDKIDEDDKEENDGGEDVNEEEDEDDEEAEVFITVVATVVNRGLFDPGDDMSRCELDSSTRLRLDSSESRSI